MSIGELELTTQSVRQPEITKQNPNTKVTEALQFDQNKIVGNTSGPAGMNYARGGKYQHMEGNSRFIRHVVIEFPSFEDAVACFESEEYQEARKFRLNGVGDNELVIVEGGDVTK